MKYFFSLVFTLFLSHLYSQQTIYKAVYTFHIKYDDSIVFRNPVMDSAKNDLKNQKYVSGTHTYKINFSQDDTGFKKKLQEELGKEGKNYFVYTIYCTPELMVSLLEYLSDNNPLLRERKTAEFNGPRNWVYDYKQNMLIKDFKYYDSLSPACERIDTALLHFKTTGKSKKINKWNCKEYVPVDVAYEEFAIWASTSLADYVHPQVFSNDIKGGIVQVVYKKENTMTLTSLDKVDKIDVEYSKSCGKQIIFNKTNLLEIMSGFF